MTVAMPSAPSDLAIRFCSPHDVPTILSFIRALARYEKLEDQVVADEAKLRATLFGDRPAAEVLLAEVDRKPVGFALFFTSYSTFLAQPGLYLEDLFVDPPFRGYGIGKALLVHLAQIAVEKGCTRYQWQVLDWNEPAIKFYEAMGARVLKEWLPVRIDGEGLARLAATSVEVGPRASS